MSEPKIGDRGVVYPEGSLPHPVIVTGVKDGVITVRQAGGWTAFLPSEFAGDYLGDPADYATCMLLFASS